MEKIKDTHRMRHDISELFAIVEADVEREEASKLATTAFTGIPINDRSGSPPFMKRLSAIMSDDQSPDVQELSHSASRIFVDYKRITSDPSRSQRVRCFKGNKLRMALCCMIAITVCCSSLKSVFNCERLFASVSRNLPYMRGRPIIYTFYEEVEDGGYGDAELLDVWIDMWYEAGWEPRILSLKDARRHPEFSNYLRALREVPLGPKPEFDKMNYLRYLAMSAIGGGYMTDVDVFPLWPLDDERDGGRFRNAISDVLDGSLVDATAELPFNGKFSLLCGGSRAEIPCLMSGSASEWNHVANVLVENGGRHILSNHWSDLLALQDILRQDNKAVDHIGAKTFDGNGVLNWLHPGELNDWNDKCAAGQFKIAVHFSPHSIMSNVDKTYWESSKKYRMRKQIARAWMAQWGERCLQEDSSYRDYLIWQKPTVDVTSYFFPAVATNTNDVNPPGSGIGIPDTIGSFTLDSETMPDVIDYSLLMVEHNEWMDTQTAPLTRDKSVKPKGKKNLGIAKRLNFGQQTRSESRVLGYEQSSDQQISPYDEGVTPKNGNIYLQVSSAQEQDRVSASRFDPVPFVAQSDYQNAGALSTVNSIVERNYQASDLRETATNSDTTLSSGLQTGVSVHSSNLEQVPEQSFVNSTFHAENHENQKSWAAWEARRDGNLGIPQKPQ